MPNVEHSTLSGSELHEPKGISAASANQVYIADGASSGDWSTIWSSWFWYYDHSASSATALTGSTKTDLTNDTGGTDTLTTYKLPNASNIWDNSSNSFDWTSGGCQLGYTVDLRIDLTYNVDTADDTFLLELDLAHGDAGEYSLPLIEPTLPETGAKRFIIPLTLYLGSSAVLNNPAKLSITADSSGDTVLLNGFFVRVIPTNPVFI